MFIISEIPDPDLVEDVPQQIPATEIPEEIFLDVPLETQEALTDELNTMAYPVNDYARTLSTVVYPVVSCTETGKRYYNSTVYKQAGGGINSSVTTLRLTTAEQDALNQQCLAAFEWRNDGMTITSNSHKGETIHALSEANGNVLRWAKHTASWLGLNKVAAATNMFNLRSASIFDKISPILERMQANRT